jgi:hypothetical protein
LIQVIETIKVRKEELGSWIVKEEEKREEKKRNSGRGRSLLSSVVGELGARS